MANGRSSHQYCAMSPEQLCIPRATQQLFGSTSSGVLAALLGCHWDTFIQVRVKQQLIQNKVNILFIVLWQLVKVQSLHVQH